MWNFLELMATDVRKQEKIFHVSGCTFNKIELLTNRYKYLQKVDGCNLPQMQTIQFNVGFE